MDDEDGQTMVFVDEDAIHKHLEAKAIENCNASYSHFWHIAQMFGGLDFAAIHQALDVRSLG